MPSRGRNPAGFGRSALIVGVRGGVLPFIRADPALSQTRPPHVHRLRMGAVVGQCARSPHHTSFTACPRWGCRRRSAACASSARPRPLCPCKPRPGGYGTATSGRLPMRASGGGASNTPRLYPSRRRCCCRLADLVCVARASVSIHPPFPSRSLPLFPDVLPFVYTYLPSRPRFFFPFFYPPGTPVV